MQGIHYELWARCQRIVGDRCGSRGASHGVSHMQRVTEQAILLYSMAPDGKLSSPEACLDLYGIILVAMLHDLADHKYDPHGDLYLSLHDFVSQEAAHWIHLATAPSPPQSLDVMALNRVGDASITQEGSLFSKQDVQMLLQEGVDGLCSRIIGCIQAISYSTETKRGLRWYEQVLPPRWQMIRNIVSDADKLEAIGEEGLQRCYAYVCEKYQERSSTKHHDESSSEAPEAVSALQDKVRIKNLEQILLKDVSTHYEEKLSRLASLFIVTPAGKFLAAPRHDAMARLLAEWQLRGPPPVASHWPDAARDGCGDG
ncbi:unnamed protein product [Phytomonas sp. EM1]|nr:unnamed protein product [Phytomonas sp. EM1]|eukprot:CCW63066.1 unnamed protein product [Phytomonas sp. isolate EM1]